MMIMELWKTQLKKGYLEFVLLLLIEKQERYGLEILEALSQTAVSINEGTLYPILSRLHKDGVIEGRWVTDPIGGHPRKYYSLSAKGRMMLLEMKKHWMDLKTTIDTIGE